MAALNNPTIDPPRLASTASRKLQSRSPSRSPVRRQDPFIRDLSPTKTLRAFSARPTGPQNDALARSIQDATQSQRALGTKVAQACADLRSWTGELEGWQWPGTFDSPVSVSDRPRMSAMTVLSRTESMVSEQEQDPSEDEYWGSLPTQTVQLYETRLEEICVDFDQINFDELKTFVLSAHSQAGVREASIDDSIGAIGAATDLKRLDDFTALITATILKALPYLPQLTRLLETWTARLSILRSAPRYLRDLQKARTDLDHGWASLAISYKRQSPNAQLSHESLEEMKTVISAQVYSLGKRLDRFLDMLEGRSEVVPDSWIDDFEDLEREYGEWVVKAERKVLEGEWKDMKVQLKDTVLKLARDEEDVNASATDGAATKGVDQPDEPTFDDFEDESSTPGAKTWLSVANVKPATRKSSEVAPWENSMLTASASKARAITSNEVAPWTDPPPKVSIDKSRSMTPDLIASSSPPRRENKTPARPRHIPIVIPYTHPDEPSNASPNTSLDLTRSTSINKDAQLARAISRTPSDQATASGNVVKQRAAFLNGDIEKSEALLKSKSAPIVRPFEHASNAFTRLFKRDVAPVQQEEIQSKQSRDIEEAQTLSVNHENGSQLSGVASSSSGKAPSSSHSGSAIGSKKKYDPRKLEYIDMVRAPSLPRGSKSLESSRGRERGRNGNKAAGMNYGDLISSAPITREALKTPRKSEDSKRSRARTVDREDRLNDVLRPARSTGMTSQVQSTVMVSSAIERRSLDETRRSMLNKGNEVQRSESLISSVSRSSQDKASPNTLPRIYRPYSRPIAIERKTPAVYRPSGLSEPIDESSFQPEQDDFPADWPLSNVATPGESGPLEEYFPNPSRPDKERSAKANDEPIRTDDFEEFFVRTLPSRPEIQLSVSSSKTAEHDFGMRAVLVRPSSAPGYRTHEKKSTLDPSMLRSAGSGKQRMDWSLRPVSMVKEEDFPDEEDLGDDLDKQLGSLGLKRSNSVPPTGLRDLKVDVPELELDTEDAHTDSTGDVVIKRASITSVELHSPDEIKSIELPRRSIDEAVAAILEPQTPIASSSADATSPLDYDGMVVLPSPPPSVPTRGSSLRSLTPSNTPDSPAKIRQRLSTSPPLVEDERSTPLNSAVSKQRKPKRRSHGNVGESVGSPEKKKPAPHHVGEDNIDRHVSEVLDRVHAPIRFKTRPGAVTPVATRAAAELRTKSKTERQAKDMTLAPAEATPRKASGTDAESKLYHLTQAGRAEPIKLFVRLVGEDERVMVRVGGGWADLADYLRQYAEHHGSRTVSESVLELQTASTPGSAQTSASAKRTFSGSAFAVDAKSRTPVVTPTAGTFAASPSETFNTRDVNYGNIRPRLWIGDDSADDEEQSPTLPRSYQVETAKTWRNVARPSTADASARPGSSQGILDSPTEPGLDGKMKTELPEQKARWVEGMIEKAMKSASTANAANVGAEKDKQKAFGDMGKVGGTRRVVFRSASGVENGAK